MPHSSRAQIAGGERDDALPCTKNLLLSAAVRMASLVRIGHMELVHLVLAVAM